MKIHPMLYYVYEYTYYRFVLVPPTLTCPNIVLYIQQIMILNCTCNECYIQDTCIAERLFLCFWLQNKATLMSQLHEKND